VRLDTSKIENKDLACSADEWRTVIESAEAKKGWQIGSSSIFSTKLLIGEYQKSAAEIEENPHKSQFGVGKFTIEYRRDVHPKQRISHLRFSCRYENGRQGWKFGN